MASTVSFVAPASPRLQVLIENLVVWEYPCNPEQGSDFLSLVAAIRIHLPEDRYLLTATLPAAKPILQNIDLRQTAEYLDTLNLTAYDFFGHWTHKSGHHAQLYATGAGGKDEPSGAAGVKDLMSSGVPGKKILLGIPLFGRSFLGVAGPGHKNRGAGGKENGSFEYCQLPRKGTKEQVDKRAVAAQCVGGDGGFVTYDNPDTVKMKAAFCKQKGLGVGSFFTQLLTHSVWLSLFLLDLDMLTALSVQGLFYWSAPSDSKDTKRSLITTGFKTLHSS
jgi:chitinase